MHTPENDALITPAIDTLDINTHPSNLYKIKYAITKLKC